MSLIRKLETCATLNFDEIHPTRSGADDGLPGATPHNVLLIKRTIGNAAAIKAAGGVRDLKTVLELYRCGATRFGVSHVAGGKILDECAALPGGEVEV